MLRTKDIIDKPGYLAQLLSQDCPYARALSKCALKNLRGLFKNCAKFEIEADLVMIKNASAQCRSDGTNYISGKLDDHFRCAYDE